MFKIFCKLVKKISTRKLFFNARHLCLFHTVYGRLSFCVKSYQARAKICSTSVYNNNAFATRPLFRGSTKSANHILCGGTSCKTFAHIKKKGIRYRMYIHLYRKIVLSQKSCNSSIHLNSLMLLALPCSVHKNEPKSLIFILPQFL